MINSRLIRIIYLMTFVLIISIHLGSSIVAIGLDGSEVQVDSNFCLDEDSGVKLLGSDFYMYCEGNFEEEYYNYTYPESTQTNIPNNLFTPDEIYFEVNPKDNIETSSGMINNSIIDTSGEVGPNFEGDDIRGDNWPLFLGLFGIVLLLVIAILIIAHRLTVKRDERNQIINLRPYINNLARQGYSENQLEELLLKKGYESSFINKLLNKK